MNYLTYRTLRIGSIAAALPLLLLGCGSDGVPIPDPDPVIGSSEFVSADGTAGQGSPDLALPPEAGAPGDDNRDDGGGERTVEEGDIYRVLGDGHLLNLNAYRGLQVVDLSDVSAPAIVGRLQVTGSPVEMYAVGDRAIVLLNNWRGYYGQRDDVAVDTVDGGLVMLVDISDPNAPVALDQAHVPGNIETSRLTRGDTQSALYVAASEWYRTDNPVRGGSYDTRTVVKSFDVSGDELVYRSELDLGGYVTAIQATPEVLLVARDQGWDAQSSEVSVIDISNPNGTMVEGDSVAVSGYVGSQFHMDFRGDVLRVLSGPRWGDGDSSHLQTWDASDLSALVAVDDEPFGTGETLYGAIFLADRAFAVTYLRVDPFHAFSIAADGKVEEVSEYVVSGWNDFFRPVLDNTRLIGIGIDDTNGRKVSVSMYDITELSNPEPLVSRAEVSGSSNGWNWSEANWDHRAFSVLDNAVEVTTDSGVTETGLVLLPFSGWNEADGRYQSAVQIYTFSGTTLTRRGLMEHGSPVRRSFLADDETTVNLSEAELSLYDHTTPDAPVKLGGVALAPDYSQVLSFGDYRVRIAGNNEYWYAPLAEAPGAKAEVIPASEDADSATAVASFEIHPHAQVFTLGQNLVTVSGVYVPDGDNYDYETTVEVFDLSEPTAPTRRGGLITRALEPSSYGYGYEDCFDCFWWGYRSFDSINVVGEALTFLRTDTEQELIGNEEVCSTWVNDAADCWDQEECTYYTGYRDCSSLNGGPEACTGGFARCTYSDNSSSCEPVELEDVDAPIESRCYTGQRYRYWQRYSIDAIDLSNPARPALAPSVTLPRADEGVSVLANDNTLYVTVKRPVQVADDPRPYVRYSIKRIDYSQPWQPVVGNAVNVPGELVAVDGSTIYTRDLVWGEQVAETALARLNLTGNRAYLRGHYRFTDREVEQVAIDERGLALVSHRPLWRYDWGYVGAPQGPDNELHQLTVLAPTATGRGLATLSEVDVDAWANLRQVASGRALFQVPGGLLVFNLEDAEAPSAQAYFATPGWPSDFVVEDGRVLFAAGRYGIYDFGLDTFNLLPSE
ncbi:beta-propeller domain-containing protein [Haliangium sp.]|uniref:beta-propeller domain-containing protein n=1 Tax=Haliangium sp. TaxID=2663208 RepID=UPI003D0DB2C8